MKGGESSRVAWDESILVIQWIKNNGCMFSCCPVSSHVASLYPISPFPVVSASHIAALVSFLLNPRMPCNVPPPPSPRQGPFTSGSFIGYRIPSQTNTCLFCTLCPHSCAPEKNFPVGHPFPNFSGPSTLNLGVLWRLASEKSYNLLVWVSY